MESENDDKLVFFVLWVVALALLLVLNACFLVRYRREKQNMESRLNNFFVMDYSNSGAIM